MDSFIRGSKRFDYCAENTAGITELFEEAHGTLFKRILSNENHTLYQLLAQRTDHGYNLRKRMHEHKLPEKNSASAE